MLPGHKKDLLDCSSITFVDMVGRDALIQLYEDFSKIDVTVFFAYCKGEDTVGRCDTEYCKVWLARLR